MLPRPFEITSEELALRAQGGSRDAFGELVQRHEGSLVRFLRPRAPSLAEAEELAQEAFLRAWRKLDRYDPAQRFSTWLFTLARNLATSHARVRKPPTAEFVEAMMRVDERDPSHAALARESADSLWSLADLVLTPEQREALWLRYGEDLAAEEIGAVMKKRAVAVRVLLFRARETLARHLERAQPTDERAHGVAHPEREKKPSTPRVSEAWS